MKIKKDTLGEMIMEKKKMVLGAGILFLALVLINITLQFFDFSGFPTFAMILLPQACIIVPVILYVIITKQNFFELIRFRKMNFWSVLLIIPVTYLLNPLLTCINAFSMAFSTNMISGTMGSIADELPYIAGLSLMALLPALTEEITFRGVMLNSFHRDSNPWPAILFSAVCFGCMHMNLNQMAYALVLGILMGIILEASGSIISTMLVHFIFNGTSISLMYLLPKFAEWYMKLLEHNGMTLEQVGLTQQDMDALMNIGQTTTASTPEQMLMTGTIMLIPAIIGLVLAGLLIYLIAYLNKRQLILKGMFMKKSPEQKQAMAADKVRIMNPALGIAIGICVIFSIVIEVLLRISGM